MRFGVLGGGGLDGAVQTAWEEDAAGDARTELAVDDVQDLVGRARESDRVGGVGGDDRAGGRQIGREAETCFVPTTKVAAEGRDLVGVGEVGIGGFGECGSDGAAGDHGADDSGVVTLDGEDSGRGGEVGLTGRRGAEQRSRAVIGGDADVFKHEGSDEEAVKIGEGIEGGTDVGTGREAVEGVGEVDGRAGNGGAAES